MGHMTAYGTFIYSLSCRMNHNKKYGTFIDSEMGPIFHKFEYAPLTNLD
jgi:hypothetical protein